MAERKTVNIMNSGGVVSVFEDEVEKFTARPGWRRLTDEESKDYEAKKGIAVDSETEVEPKPEPKSVTLAGNAVISGSIGVGDAEPETESEPESEPGMHQNCD